MTYDEVLEQSGLTAKWEARGEEKKALEIARNMLKNGLPVELGRESFRAGYYESTILRKMNTVVKDRFAKGKP